MVRDQQREDKYIIQVPPSTKNIKVPWGLAWAKEQ